MNVLILSYETFNNVGESFLGDATEYLVRSSKNCTVNRAQLVPSYKEACKYNIFAWVGAPLQYIAQKLGNRGVIAHDLWKLIYRIRLHAYYKSLIKKNNKIILAVGMLKFKNQNFSYIFSIICCLATKLHKEVLLNAMSVARADNDVRFHQLVDAINMPCVKGVSTRDGKYGLSLLQDYYIKQKKIRIDDVGDPALWIPEIYQIRRNCKSLMIGINLIDPTIYSSYGYETYTPMQMEKLYNEIIKELNEKKYEWKLYCNGMAGDYAFGKKLLINNDLPLEKLLPCPKNSKEYLRQISNFRAIFGARLHADISAYALGIPFVGLLWDSKLKYFGETMGIHQFFISVDNLNGKSVVSKIEEAMVFDYDFERREFYKKKTETFISSFLFD